jgi:NADPH-dependent curcumin reductase CurA
VIHESAANTYVRLPADPGIPLPTLLGACGTSGVTAYYGLTDIAPVKAGETLVVSAAAGSVGSIAGQIGKIMGARVVGIAGGADKCRLPRRRTRLRCRRRLQGTGLEAGAEGRNADGIHVNFENVGGDIMKACCRAWSSAAASRCAG